MTDRIRTLTVVLDRDMRTDDVEGVKQTIGMIRYVADVQDGAVVNSDDWLNRSTALREFIALQYKFLRLFGGLTGAEAEDKLKRIKEILGGVQ